MTVDHSAAELIGAKNDKEVNPMFRGMILRAVGIQPSVELERTEVPLKARDKILICSDGLSRMVSDRKLLSIIRASEDLETTADKLIAAANDAGGVDNITVELIEVGALPVPLPTSPLVSAANVDPVAEAESVSTNDTNTHKTKGNGGTVNTTTEDDFIPSTEGDGDVENAEEDLNIPESDTEDDSPDDAPFAEIRCRSPCQNSFSYKDSCPCLQIGGESICHCRFDSHVDTDLLCCCVRLFTCCRRGQGEK